MAKATIERETHFRKKGSKTEVYSEFFNSVRKNGKFKNGKNGVFKEKKQLNITN